MEKPMLKSNAALKGSYQGQTATLICNGPGLANVPLEFLQKYPTLGCNRITMLYPAFCPTFYFGMGANQLDTPEKRATILPVILDDRCEAAWINRLMIHEFAFTNKCYTWMGGKAYGVSGDRLKTWSKTPYFSVGIGYTMVYPILQMALWLGFDPILIVGMDHKYPPSEDKQKHFYKDDEGYASLFEVAPGPYTSAAWRRNTDGILAIAKAEFDKAKKRIVNLSNPTECTIFETGRLEDW